MPDHGDAWAREWHGEPPAVDVPGVGTLVRRIGSDGGDLSVSYTIHGAPGTAFLHAVHALLDVSPSARLVVPRVRRVTILDPEVVEAVWPSGLDRLGPDDGTAVCALLERCGEVVLVDNDDSLRFRWSAPGADHDCSLLLWRNLRGWPAASPYRSIGIEPMVGRAADLATADAEHCAVVGEGGRYSWHLRITAAERVKDAGTVAHPE